MKFMIRWGGRELITMLFRLRQAKQRQTVCKVQELGKRKTDTSRIAMVNYEGAAHQLDFDLPAT